MDKLIKFTHDSYGGPRRIIYLSPIGIEKIEQSDKDMVTIFYQQHCAFVDGQVDEVAKTLGYKKANNG